MNANEQKGLTPEQISKNYEELVKQLQYARFQADAPQPKTIRIPQPGDDNLLPDFRSLDDGVFNAMPSLLKRAFDTLQHKHEKEVFLTGALGVFSAMMPNIYGDYFGFPLGTNLYCFVLGRYGTGKGVLNLCRLLGDAVHQYRREQGQAQQAIYARQMEAYNSNMRLYKRGESDVVPQLPQAPPHLRLYIPANSSKTGVIKLVAENQGRGIMFETEGDTLTEMLQQEFGNFSDVLRKAFHHEAISYYRKTNDEEVEINTPYFSIVLSGTYDQLYKLVPQAENGLYSRFCYYIQQGDTAFLNPFDKARNNRKPVLEGIGQEWLPVYQLLEARTTPLRFVLPEYQEEKFWLLLKQRKAEILEHISDKLEGMIHRMGVIFFRIAMILSVLRHYDRHEGWEGDIICTDTDFELALEITVWFLQYSLRVYELLPGTKQEEKKEVDADIFNSKEGDRRECCRLFANGLNARQIAAKLFNGAKKSTVNDWINKYCKKRA